MFYLLGLLYAVGLEVAKAVVYALYNSDTWIMGYDHAMAVDITMSCPKEGGSHTLLCPLYTKELPSLVSSLLYALGLVTRGVEQETLPTKCVSSLCGFQCKVTGP